MKYLYPHIIQKVKQLYLLQVRENKGIEEITTRAKIKLEDLNFEIIAS